MKFNARFWVPSMIQLVENLHKINRDEINKSADDEKDWFFFNKTDFVVNRK